VPSWCDAFFNHSDNFDFFYLYLLLLLLLLLLFGYHRLE